MNLSCEIIKDLLPLYHDGVCSEQSKILVEEHIAQCALCGETLGIISDEPIAQNAEDRDETDLKPAEVITKTFNKIRLKAFLKGAGIAALICGVTVGIFALFIEVKVFPVSGKKIEVSDVYQLEDGRIAYRFDIADNRELEKIRYECTEDGKLYMIPERSVIEGKRKEPGMMNRWDALDIEKMSRDNREYRGFDDDFEVTAIYMGAPKNAVLIWEQGMELPPASEEMNKGLERHYSPDGMGWYTIGYEGEG